MLRRLRKIHHLTIILFDARLLHRLVIYNKSPWDEGVTGLSNDITVACECKFAFFEDLSVAEIMDLIWYLDIARTGHKSELVPEKTFVLKNHLA